MTPFAIQGTDVTLESLLALQAISADLRQLRPQLSRARALGEQRSRFRGQGREFAEMKPYHVSDDVRRIDWRLTARKQRPYVRVMEEDRHQEHVIWLPLSRRHYFGTRRCLKSVMLCHWAAFLLWRFAQLHHPVRLIVEVGPHGVQRHIMNQRQAAEACRLLSDSHLMLADQFKTLVEPSLLELPQWTSSPTLWVLSDFTGNEAERCRAALQHQPVSSLLYLQCSDPFDHQLPPDLRLPVRSGQQLSIIESTQLDKARRSLTQHQTELHQDCLRYHGALIHHRTPSFSWQEVQQWPLYH